MVSEPGAKVQVVIKALATTQVAPLLAVTSQPDIAAPLVPPLVQETTAFVLPGVAVTPVGALGGVDHVKVRDPFAPEEGEDVLADVPEIVKLVPDCPP